MAKNDQNQGAQPAPAAARGPRRGVRRIRVRAKLADGRQFLSASTFIVPAAKDQ